MSEPSVYSTTEWKEARERALKRDGGACVRCGASDSDAVIDVHHIDEDNTNHAISNLRTLCRGCHRMLHERDGQAVGTAILDALRDGRCTKGYLVDAVDAHRNTVWRHLQLLEEGGHINCVHEGTRLYALVDDPREE